MKINRKTHTIIQLDIIDINLCVKFEMIKKAVKFFSKEILKDQILQINTALELIEFWRQSTLLTFDGKLYEFGIVEDKKDKGTPIGGKDRAFSMQSNCVLHPNRTKIYVYQWYDLHKNL